MSDIIYSVRIHGPVVSGQEILDAAREVFKNDGLLEEVARVVDGINEIEIGTDAGDSYRGSHAGEWKYIVVVGENLDVTAINPTNSYSRVGIRMPAESTFSGGGKRSLLSDSSIDDNKVKKFAKRLEDALSPELVKSLRSSSSKKSKRKK